MVALGFRNFARADRIFALELDEALDLAARLAAAAELVAWTSATSAGERDGF
jgi:hypothetical protein